MRKIFLHQIEDVFDSKWIYYVTVQNSVGCNSSVLELLSNTQNTSTNPQSFNGLYRHRMTARVWLTVLKGYMEMIMGL